MMFLDDHDETTEDVVHDVNVDVNDEKFHNSLSSNANPGNNNMVSYHKKSNFQFLKFGKRKSELSVSDYLVYFSSYLFHSHTQRFKNILLHKDLNQFTKF